MFEGGIKKAATRVQKAVRKEQQSHKDVDRAVRVANQVLYGFEVLERMGLRIPKAARSYLRNHIDSKTLNILEYKGKPVLASGGGVQTTGEYTEMGGIPIIKVPDMRLTDRKGADQTDMTLMHEMIHAVLEHAPAFRDSLVGQAKEDYTDWFTKTIARINGYNENGIKKYVGKSAYRSSALDDPMQEFMRGQTAYRDYIKKAERDLLRVAPEILAKARQRETANKGLERLARMRIIDHLVPEGFSEKAAALSSRFVGGYTSTVKSKYGSEKSPFTPNDALVAVDHVLSGDLHFEGRDFSELHERLKAIHDANKRVLGDAPEEVHTVAAKNVLYSQKDFRGVSMSKLMDAVDRMAQEKGYEDAADMFRGIIEEHGKPGSRITITPKEQKVVEGWLAKRTPGGEIVSQENLGVIRKVADINRRIEAKKKGKKKVTDWIKDRMELTKKHWAR